MKPEERRQYNKDYRAEGFGRLADRRYYLKHRDELVAKQALRNAKKRAAKFSQ